MKQDGLMMDSVLLSLWWRANWLTYVDIVIVSPCVTLSGWNDPDSMYHIKRDKPGLCLTKVSFSTRKHTSPICSRVHGIHAHQSNKAQDTVSHQIVRTSNGNNDEQCTFSCRLDARFQLSGCIWFLFFPFYFFPSIFWNLPGIFMVYHGYWLFMD